MLARMPATWFAAFTHAVILLLIQDSSVFNAATMLQHTESLSQ